MKIGLLISVFTTLYAVVAARSHYRPVNKSPTSRDIHQGPGQPSRNGQEHNQHNPRDNDRDKLDHPRTNRLSPAAQAQHTGVDWMQRGQDELNDALNVWPKWKPARNVIYFIGDGMGVSTLTAGRILKAQEEGLSVTEASLSWEQLPYSGLIKTYSTDQQVPDSAGTATAFACGEKARAGVIGVNEDVRESNCSSVAGNELKSIIHYAQDEGKWAGIVSNTRITHATPAAAYAHSPNRDWEADRHVPEEDRDTCWDIARQLIHNDDNKLLRVVLGGGKKAFYPETLDDTEPPHRRGDRQDGRDLRQEWLDIKAGMGLSEWQYQYVENKTDFNNVHSNSTEYLFGLFEHGHMKFEANRVNETGDTWTEPSLAEMVKKSLDILKRGPEGYVLYVEGGRIDHAHHDSHPHYALVEVMGLQDAVQVAMDETDQEDTLLLVTADHSHVFSMGGYPRLDNDILGLSIELDEQMELAKDDKPYTTLGYANGIGFLTHRSDGISFRDEQPRLNLTGVDTRAYDFEFDSPIPLFSETHGGEDVVVYARGPMAHLLSGQHEQHYIAHAAMYAACLGWNKDLCQSNPLPPDTY